MDGVDNIIRTISTNRDEELTVTVLAIFRSGFSILQTGKELQRRCAEMIEKMTAFNMGHIDIEIHSLK